MTDSSQISSFNFKDLHRKISEFSSVINANQGNQ